MGGSFPLTNPCFNRTMNPPKYVPQGYTTELSPIEESIPFPVTVGPVPNTILFREGFSACCFDVIVQNLFSP